jgi:DNA-binding CsgD family transcriptional regulator
MPDGPSLWSAIIHEPGTSVVISDMEGQVLYANPQAAELFLGPSGTVEELQRPNGIEQFPAEWTEERLRVIRQVAQDGRPRLLRSIWQGYQHHSWIHPLAPQQQGQPVGRVLILTRRAHDLPAGVQRPDSGVEVVEAQVNQLGPLSRLTPRELEVLALLGRGLSIKQIAKELHRAPKTIENHRNALGEKLGVSDRVELAEIARRAGLKIEDARKPRV